MQYILQSHGCKKTRQLNTMSFQLIQRNLHAFLMSQMFLLWIFSVTRLFSTKFCAKLNQNSTGTLNTEQASNQASPPCWEAERCLVSAQKLVNSHPQLVLRGDFQPANAETIIVSYFFSLTGFWSSLSPPSPVENHGNANHYHWTVWRVYWQPSP